MDHFPELTYSMYADRELAEPERLRVQRHLDECETCYRLVTALEAENGILADAFRVEEPARARSRVWRSLLLTVVSAMVVALGLDRVLEGLRSLAPGAFSWMNPFNLSWFQGFFFSDAFDLIREGPAMLNALVTILGVLVLGAAVFGILRHFIARHHSMSLATLAAALVALSLAAPASAMEKRGGQVVRVGAAETVQESLFASGETIEIDGTVNGNVIAAGRRVVVQGVVKGDLVTLDQDTQISGTVEGNVYGLCRSLMVLGHVGRNVYFWGDNLQLEPSGRVDGDVLGGGDDIRLAGGVGRDVSATSATLESSGPIGRNLQTYSGLVTIDGSARIAGNLEAHVHKASDAVISPGATIAGNTEILLVKKSAGHYGQAKFYFWQAIWLAGALIAGLLLYWLAPGLFAAPLDTGSALLGSGGLGFLALVATPIAVIIACITLVGLPSGLLTLVLWGVALYLAKIFVGAALGQNLLRARSGERPAFALALLLGLIIVFVAINLPYAGGWLSFLVILAGLGLAVRGVGLSIRRRPALP